MSDRATRTVVDLADHLNDPDADGADIDALMRAVEHLAAARPELAGVDALVTHDRSPLGVDAHVRPTTDFGGLDLGGRGSVLLAGRMILPGHPAVDYRRYELGLFSYDQAPLPDWFPRPDVGSPRFLVGELLKGTDGLANPSVFAVFSELVTAIDQDSDSTRQELALLLARRVERVFWDRPAVVARTLGLDSCARHGDRLIALQAHEWGHWTSRHPYQQFVESAENDPVHEEWLADARAITMLWAEPLGRGPAEALLFDKLFRSAWYPTVGRRPDATASRLLVRAALYAGLLRLDDGRARLVLDDVAELLAESVDDPGAIGQLLTRHPPHASEARLQHAYAEVAASAAPPAEQRRRPPMTISKEPWVNNPPSQRIDATALAQERQDEVRAAAQAAREAGTPIALATVLVGDDPGSAMYVTMKQEEAAKLGLDSHDLRLPASTSQAELNEILSELSSRSDIDAILVQYPLPKHLDYTQALLAVDPDKDVDGLHPTNLGLLAMGEPRLTPCTPRGIVDLLERSELATNGAATAIVGRGLTVGRPLSILLSSKRPDGNASVVLVHTGSTEAHLRSAVGWADIVIGAAGAPGLIKPEWLRNRPVLVAAGVSFPSGKAVSDFAKGCRDQARAWTPTVGGVGPMTRAWLYLNAVRCRELKRGR